MRNMLSTYKFDFIRFMFAQRFKFRFVLVLLLVVVCSVCWSLVLYAKGPAQREGREEEREREEASWGGATEKSHVRHAANKQVCACLLGVHVCVAVRVCACKCVAYLMQFFIHTSCPYWLL